MSNQVPCSFCQGRIDFDCDWNVFSCERCGKYRRESALLHALTPGAGYDRQLAMHLAEPDVTAELTVAIRDANRHGGVVLLTKQFLHSVRPLGVNARLDRMVIRVGDLSRRPGMHVPLHRNEPWILGAYDAEDAEGLLILASAKGWAERGAATFDAKVGPQVAVSLTAGGWDRFDELSKGRGSDQGFVAMWFSADMLPFFDSVLAPAITLAGYVPRRIDRKEHNNRIDDEIMVEIRRSAFVVADFSGHRAGVYFEAGYALGLGKPVIWTIQESELPELARLSFDTRQFNHLIWNPGDDLGTRLTNRILNTVGPAPNWIPPEMKEDG